MAVTGDMLRDAVASYIASWNAGLRVKTEVNLGLRFVGTPRKIDLLVYNPRNNKAVGIECKLQQTRTLPISMRKMAPWQVVCSTSVTPSSAGRTKKKAVSAP